MNTKATSVEIALLAGVSQSTVSRALRGSESVSLETRNRIQEIARRLNYTVDRNASSLRRQETQTLALLIFEDPTSVASLINPFFVTMLASITRAAARRGYDLLISFQQLSGDWHTTYEDSRRADGIVLLGYGDYMLYRSRLEQLVKQGTHFVRWGAVMENQPGISIGSDNFEGGRLAGEHLIRRCGRRRLAFIGTASAHYPEFLERYRGFERAALDSGGSAQIVTQVDALSTETAGFDAARRLIELNQGVDGIFTASDLLAVGAMAALDVARIRVPSEVSVVGFDDIPAASLANPKLTTIAQDTRSAGDVLVESLVDRIHGEDVTGKVLPVRLVVRNSCGGVSDWEMRRRAELGAADRQEG